MFIRMDGLCVDFDLDSECEIVAAACLSCRLELCMCGFQLKVA